MPKQGQQTARKRKMSSVLSGCFTPCFDHNRDGVISKAEVLQTSQIALEYIKSGTIILKIILLKVNTTLVTDPSAKKSMEEAINILGAINSTATTAKTTAEIASRIKIPEGIPDINGDGKQDWYDLMLAYSTEGIKASDEVLEAVLELLVQFQENNIDVGAAPGDIEKIRGALQRAKAIAGTKNAAEGLIVVVDSALDAAEVDVNIQNAVLNSMAVASAAVGNDRKVLLPPAVRKALKSILDVSGVSAEISTAVTTTTRIVDAALSENIQENLLPAIYAAIDAIVAAAHTDPIVADAIRSTKSILEVTLAYDIMKLPEAIDAAISDLQQKDLPKEISEAIIAILELFKEIVSKASNDEIVETLASAMKEILEACKVEPKVTIAVNYSLLVAAAALSNERATEIPDAGQKAIVAIMVAANVPDKTVHIVGESLQIAAESVEMLMAARNMRNLTAPQDEPNEVSRASLPVANPPTDKTVEVGRVNSNKVPALKKLRG